MEIPYQTIAVKSVKPSVFFFPIFGENLPLGFSDGENFPLGFLVGEKKVRVKIFPTLFSEGGKFLPTNSLQKGTKINKKSQNNLQNASERPCGAKMSTKQFLF